MNKDEIIEARSRAIALGESILGRMVEARYPVALVNKQGFAPNSIPFGDYIGLPAPSPYGGTTANEGLARALINGWDNKGALVALLTISINAARRAGAESMRERAAALARANKTAPAGWRDGRWFHYAAEEIADAIMTLPVEE